MKYHHLPELYRRPYVIGTCAACRQRVRAVGEEETVRPCGRASCTVRFSGTTTSAQLKANQASFGLAARDWLLGRAVVGDDLLAPAPATREEHHARLAAIDAVLPDLATRARSDGATLPGWVPLLEKLAAAVAETLHDEDRFELRQVKEKLGALRVYVFAESSNDARQRRLEDLAEWAEQRSTTLCMLDGTDDGRLVDDRGWWCTLGDRALALPIAVLHEEFRRFG